MRQLHAFFQRRMIARHKVFLHLWVESRPDGRIPGLVAIWFQVFDGGRNEDYWNVFC